jgi:hypothetical protein
MRLNRRRGPHRRRPCNRRVQPATDPTGRTRHRPVGLALWQSATAPAGTLPVILDNRWRRGQSSRCWPPLPAPAAPTHLSRLSSTPPRRARIASTTSRGSARSSGTYGSRLIAARRWGPGRGGGAARAASAGNLARRRQGSATSEARCALQRLGSWCWGWRLLDASPFAHGRLATRHGRAPRRQGAAARRTCGAPSSPRPAPHQPMHLCVARASTTSLPLAQHNRRR